MLGLEYGYQYDSPGPRSMYTLLYSFSLLSSNGTPFREPLGVWYCFHSAWLWFRGVHGCIGDYGVGVECAVYDHGFWFG